VHDLVKYILPGSFFGLALLFGGRRYLNGENIKTGWQLWLVVSLFLVGLELWGEMR